MFEGAFVALVTPFSGDGSFDENKLKELIEFQLENGIDGIVPCGTTGESATLSHEEHSQVVERTIEIVNGRVEVLAGTGSNSTTEAIELTKHAKEAGADGALVITPYYNKPTQNGLYQHFMKIADSVDLPLITYNVPGRTGVDLLPETVAKLAEHPNIIGLKEATGQLSRASQVLEVCDEDFVLLSGDDVNTLPILAIGGKGAISVLANIVPHDVAEMYSAFKGGNLELARDLHYKNLQLALDLFIETNPIPVKTALKMMGMLNGNLRMPLTSMGEENLFRLRSTMKSAELI